MEVKKIVEGMTAPQVAQVIDENFNALNGEKATVEAVADVQKNVNRSDDNTGILSYPVFDDTEPVAVGDVRRYEGLLYRAKEAGAHDWDPEKWERVTLKQLEDEKLAELGSEVGLNYFIKWRDARRLYYNPSSKSIEIRGKKTSIDNNLCEFIVGGISYIVKDTVNSVVLSDISSGNTGIYIPESLSNTQITLNDFSILNDDIGSLHRGFVKVGHIIFAKEVSGSLISNYQPNVFDIEDFTNIDEIKAVGEYRISSPGATQYILSVTPHYSLNGHIIQKRMYANDSKTIQFQIREWDGSSWSNWYNPIEEIGKNPILNNHSEEIQYYGDARIYWDANFRKLVIKGKIPQSSNGAVVRFNYDGKTVIINNLVVERSIQTDGNAQLLISSEIENYSQISLDDIIIQEGTSWNKDKYIKIGHLIFGMGMSSFVIKDWVENTDKLKLDLHSLIEGYDYTQDVIPNKSIGSNGIWEYYGERDVLFFKLPKKGTPPTINGTLTILAYQWYSDYPDYAKGSNSLGRTTSNTPPSNAQYCGLTLLNTNEIKDITISATSKEIEKSISKGDFVNNSIGESMFADGFRKNLRILGFGNSFMRNSVHYLSQIASGMDVDLTVGNLYIGGVNLSTHLANLRNNSNPYEYHKYENGTKTVGLTSQTAKYGLQDERWDAVILHQYQPTSVMPNYEPMEPYLSQVMNAIIDILGYCPKFYINATWAGSLDNNVTYYGYETELQMWEGVRDANLQASKNSGIINIIPTGTAIQNARTLPYADSYGRFVNLKNSDYHHLNPAGGFIAACTIYEKIIYPLNKRHCNNTTFRITQDEALPPQWIKEEGMYVTDGNYNDLCEAAIKAVEKPNEVSIIS